MHRRSFLILPLVLATAAQTQQAAPDLSAFARNTTTKSGKPGDLINVGVVGSKEDLVAMMLAAGWQLPVPVSLKSSAAIAGSVAFRRAYLTAPVSTLFFQNRKQDVAFEKEVGKSASHRHHVRFWNVRGASPTSPALWLGAATYDKGVGLSHRNGAVTHHISGDVDAERDFLMAEMNGTGRLQQVITVAGNGPVKAKNGGGDAYWSDGNVAVALITAGARAP